MENMLDWDKLRIFYAVAQAGSFTRAGSGLNLSQSSISRQISSLEESIKVPLFHRHARGLVLTEQGDILLKTVKDIYAQLAATENSISDSRDRPKGPLRVTSSVTLGSTWLTPKLNAFLHIYPEIQMTVMLDDKELDLSMREADVAIRFQKPNQADLVHKHLTSFRNSIYASKGYVQQHGIPTRENELDHHRIIIFGEDYRAPFIDVNWITQCGRSHKSDNSRDYFRINGLFAMLRAVETGIGIAALPEYMAKDNPNLVHILPSLEGPKTDLYFVYASELRNSKRVKVFRDFIMGQV